VRGVQRCGAPAGAPEAAELEALRATDAVAVGPLLRRSEPPQAWHLCGDVDVPPPRACRCRVQQQRRLRRLARPPTNGPMICARSRLFGARTMEFFQPPVCFVYCGWMSISYSGEARKGSGKARLKRRGSTSGERFRASCVACPCPHFQAGARPFVAWPVTVIAPEAPPAFPNTFQDRTVAVPPARFTGLVQRVAFPAGMSRRERR
jgi:hypothetical protein